MDVLIVDDEPSIRTTTSLIIQDLGHGVATAESLEVMFATLEAKPIDVVFLDLQLGSVCSLDRLSEIVSIENGPDVVVFTAHASVSSAVKAMHEGATEYVEKPFTEEQVELVLTKIENQRRLKGRLRHLEGQLDSATPSPETNCPKMRSIWSVVDKVAKVDTGVLILGESGTGKTVLAKAIHDRGARKDGPFITVNCPALTSDLFASELFGHVRGAFTGAIKDHWGFVHAAEGGTLFLDEIGDLPPSVQPKLLRLLQEQLYERLGESSVHSADVRVIAATNRDLKESVALGEFREDLFYRLNVVSINMPPLRERKEDLELIARTFLARYGTEFGRRAVDFDEASWDLIRRHNWPGNIRELRNFIERQVLLADCIPISIDPNISTIVQSNTNDNNVDDASDSIHLGDRCTLKEIEREHVRRVIDACETLSEAAEVLGIDPTTLYRKRRELADASQLQA